MPAVLCRIHSSLPAICLIFIFNFLWVWDWLLILWEKKYCSPLQHSGTFIDQIYVNHVSYFPRWLVCQLHWRLFVSWSSGDLSQHRCAFLWYDVKSLQFSRLNSFTSSDDDDTRLDFSCVGRRKWLFAVQGIGASFFFFFFHQVGHINLQPAMGTAVGFDFPRGHDKCCRPS